MAWTAQLLLLHRELCGRGHCTGGSPGSPPQCLLSCPGSGLGGRDSTLLLSPLGTLHLASGLVLGHTLHLVVTRVAQSCIVRPLRAQLSGALGWLFWPQPAQVGLELSQSSRAPWLLCRGKSKAALIETGPAPCPQAGQHRESCCPAGQAGVPVREGLDAGVVLWCVPARESLVWQG